MEAVVDGVSKSRNLRINRISGFVARDVERDYSGSSKLLYQLGCYNSLLGIEMAQGAKNEAAIDAAGSNRGFGGAVDGGNHLFGRQSALEVQQRRKANFGVDDPIGGELLEEILNYQSQGRFVLHQFEAARRACQKIRQAGAAPGSDELTLVLFERYRVIELGHRGEA
jgi:hypothetical protein